MYTPYVRISTGNVQTVLDSVARNPVGSIYSPPANLGAPLSTKGLGAQPVYKYLYYNSTTNPAPVAGPAPVYYTDETFTTVSGNAAEAFITVNGCCLAGYLQPNTTAISGLTAAELITSYCFVQIGGLAVGVYPPQTGTLGIGLAVGAATTGNWATIGTATLPKIAGFQMTVVASGLCDVLMTSNGTFWGS